MDKEQQYELARRGFEGLSEEDRARMLGAVERVLSEASGGDVPPPEVVRSVALECCMKLLVNAAAAAEEFMTDEVLERYYAEETTRLAPLYPDGVPDEVLEEAMLQRAA